MTLVDRALVFAGVLVAFSVFFSGAWLCACFSIWLGERYGWDLGPHPGVLAWGAFVVAVLAAVFAP